MTWKDKALIEKYETENWARCWVSTTHTQNPFPTWATLTHAVLTVGTCFLWTPIWVIHYWLHPKTKTSITYWQ